MLRLIMVVQKIMKYATGFHCVIAYLINCVLVFAVFFATLQVAFFVPIRHLFIGSEDWPKVELEHQSLHSANHLTSNLALLYPM